MSLQSLLHEPAVSEGATSFSGLSGLRDRASFSVTVVSGALSISGTSSAEPTKVWEAPFTRRMRRRAALREIRVRAAPSWDADEVGLMLWFIRNEDEPTFENQRWDYYLDAWLKRGTKKDRFVDVAGVMTTLDDLTAREYVESDPLDLDHLSSREG